MMVIIKSSYENPFLKECPSMAGMRRALIVPVRVVESLRWTGGEAVVRLLPGAQWLTVDTLTATLESKAVEGYAYHHEFKFTLPNNSVNLLSRLELYSKERWLLAAEYSQGRAYLYGSLLSPLVLTWGERGSMSPAGVNVYDITLAGTDRNSPLPLKRL